MNQKDQLKVIVAGFCIIRAEPQSLKIKYKDKDNRDWKTYAKDFKSKAAMQREIDFLLSLHNVIED